MSTILPQPPTPSLPTTASAAPVVTVPSPPLTLAELANGATVRAEIVALLSRGLIEVSSDHGNFQLRSNLALREGAQLELQLLRSVPQLQFAIRGIDGHALPGQIDSAGGRQPGAAANPATAATPASANAGQAASSLLSPANLAQTGATAGPPQAPPLAAGTTISATVLPQPGSGATPQPSTAQTASLGTPAPAAPGTTPTTGATGPIALPAPGTRFDINLVSVSAGPTQSAAGTAQPQGTSPATPTPAGAVSGSVTAFTPTGRAIVETPQGLLALETDADIRIGQRLTFTIVPQAARSDAATATANFIGTFLQTKTWPSLEQAFGLHPQNAPGEKTQTGPVANLPQPNSQLAQNLLNAAAAIAKGDLRQLLGDTANRLEQEQPELFRRINDEFAQLARVANETRPDEWRTALLPFFNGSHLEPVQMHLRGEKEQKGKKKKEGGARFVIDLDLTNLGRFQLDGFMRDRGQTKNFDLIVRTEKPLPLHMRRDLNKIFVDFTDAAGIKGGITFQARVGFVEISAPQMAGRAEAGLII